MSMQTRILVTRSRSWTDVAVLVHGGARAAQRRTRAGTAAVDPDAGRGVVGGHATISLLTTASDEAASHILKDGMKTPPGIRRACRPSSV
jgi:hypothetical protein